MGVGHGRISDSQRHRFVSVILKFALETDTETLWAEWPEIMNLASTHSPNHL